MRLLKLAVVLWLLDLFRRYRNRARALASSDTVHLLLSPTANRVDEEEAEETNIPQRVSQGLEYLQANAKRGKVTGAGGVEISYAEFPSNVSPSACTVLFLTGWTESMLKYGDLFQELAAHGCRVVAMDHRSHGWSGEASSTARRANKTHVLEFQDHVTDALLVVNATTNLQSPLYIMGFSLGGLVALELNKLVPSAGLVLISPCLHVNVPVLSRGVMRTLLGLVKHLPKAEEEFVVGHPYALGAVIPLPPLNTVTSSKPRAHFWNQIRENHPESCINGMSWRHLYCFVTPEVSASQVLAPQVLVISAQLDTIVDNSAVFDFCEQRGSGLVRHVHVHGAKHDVLAERNSLRQLAMKEILGFLK
ncbi:hypothetical protein BASA81_002169 [Batrachochytrium salamandrivorans]|nr:hypothetical protein BASA81_002169 [Batrachochytrium salamandrivorans]